MGRVELEDNPPLQGQGWGPVHGVVVSSHLMSLR